MYCSTKTSKVALLYDSKKLMTYKNNLAFMMFSSRCHYFFSIVPAISKKGKTKERSLKLSARKQKSDRNFFFKSSRITFFHKQTSAQVFFAPAAGSL
jgi:hypothetical protein